MSVFVDNVNAYLNYMKIKRSYVSLLCKIERTKLDQILDGKQNENADDVTLIADALGKPVSFFQSETFKIPEDEEHTFQRLAFYAGSPTEKQELIANHLIEMMENIDYILSAKERFARIARN